MSINDEDGDGYQPLVDNLIKFDQLSEKISENIGLIKDYIEILNEYKDKMGTPEDTRTMRRKMTNEINEGNEVIKQTLEMFREFDDLKFKRKKDVDNFKKLSRRLTNTFDEDNEKFTKILKEIHSKEKIHLELKNSLNHGRSSSSSVLVSTTSEQEGDMKVDEENEDYEFLASIIEERQSVLQKRKSYLKAADGEGDDLCLNPDESGIQSVVRRKSSRRGNKKSTFRDLLRYCASLCDFGKSKREDAD